MNQAHPIPAEEVMAFLDGELPAEQAAGVSAHLEQCAACREVAAGFRHVSAQVAAWTVEPAPARMTYNVKTALMPKPRVRPWVWQSALAAMAVLVIGVIATPNLLRSRGTVPKYAAADTRQREIPPAPMIARTASLVLITKEFDRAREAMERIVRQHQGYVARLQASAQTDAGRTLAATLRVPAAQVDAALAELKGLGHVEQESQGGEEVTQQYVDLVARLTNARNTEQRLTAVLRQRADKMTDVLAVEREIARVRGEIEQLDAQRLAMEKRVALATVDVQIREEFKAEVNPGPPSSGRRLWNAAVEGYRNVSETIMGIAEFLLASGPTVLLWALILWFPARFVWRLVRGLVLQ